MTGHIDEDGRCPAMHPKAGPADGEYIRYGSSPLDPALARCVFDRGHDGDYHEADYGLGWTPSHFGGLWDTPGGRMTTYTPEDIERMLGLGIALTEGHMLAESGPRPANWNPAPNTMAMARKELAYYADRRFLDAVNAGTGVTVRGIQSAMDAKDNWGMMVHSVTFLSVLGVAKDTMMRAWDAWEARKHG